MSYVELQVEGKLLRGRRGVAAGSGGGMGGWGGGDKIVLMVILMALEALSTFQGYCTRVL